MQRKAAAQAQALATRQEAMTGQESLELVKALLRVSIYHVSCAWGGGQGRCLPPAGCSLAPVSLPAAPR